MIITALLLGATAIAVGSAISYYWNDIAKWLKKGITKVSRMVGESVHGFKFFIEKRNGKINERSLNYLKKGKVWHEYSVTREISEREVPSEILAKVQGRNSVELTQELAMELN